MYSAAECPIYLFFLNIINGFKGIECLPFKGIPSGFQKHSSVCVPNDMTQVLLELRLQHYTVIVMGFSTYGSAMQKNPKVLLKFPQFKTLQSCSSKQECCSLFNDNIQEQMYSFTHSPSFTSAVVFGSPLQLLAAGQVPVHFLSTGHQSVLAVICL